MMKQPQGLFSHNSCSFLHSPLDFLSYKCSVILPWLATSRKGPVVFCGFPGSGASSGGAQYRPIFFQVGFPTLKERLGYLGRVH
jgi:hypothetical protein